MGEFEYIKKCFGELCEPLRYLFNLLIVKEIFQRSLRYIKLTTAVILAIISNYRLLSVLPCFSKMLERIMQNRLQKHLKDKNIM